MNKRKLLTLMGGSKKIWTALFNGTTTSINAGTEASVDDLHAGAFTAEIFCRLDSTGGGGFGRIFNKTGGASRGWDLWTGAGMLTLSIFFATTSITNKTFAATVLDSKFHHLALTYDHAGDKKARIFWGGVLLGETTASVGDAVTDAADTLFIGNNTAGNRGLDGRLGWVRISNSVRYAANFTPPSRFIYPAVDANTVRLFKVNEATGTTITDYSSNAQNATLANGTWVKS